MNNLTIRGVHKLTSYSDDEIHSVSFSETSDLYRVYMLHNKLGSIGFIVGREIIKKYQPRYDAFVSICYDEDRMTVMGVDAAPLHYMSLENINTPEGLINQIKTYIEKVL